MMPPSPRIRKTDVESHPIRLLLSALDVG